MNIIDIIVFLIVVWQLVSGYRKGLILTAFGFVGNFVAFLLVYMYQDLFKGFLISISNLDKFIYNLLFDKVQAFTVKTINGFGDSNKDSLLNFPLPREMKDNIMEAFQTGVTNAAHEITTLITDMALSILSAVLLYFIISLAIKWLARVLNLVSKLPIINSFNKLGGVLISLGILYFLFIIISSVVLLMTTLIHNEAFLQMVASSKFMQFMSENKAFISFF